MYIGLANITLGKRGTFCNSEVGLNSYCLQPLREEKKMGERLEERQTDRGGKREVEKERERARVREKRDR